MSLKVFQKNDDLNFIPGEIPYYSTLTKYLILVGQHPQQSNLSRKTILTILLISLISLLVPSFITITTSFRDKDMDAGLECVPILVTILVSVIKIVNLNANREQFRTIYELVVEEWRSLRQTDKIHVLDDISGQGSKVAQLYRSTLITFLVFFALLPMMPLFLDVILPLNETRLRQQVFRLEYLVNGDKYFYPIYFHSVWTSVTIVIIITTVDSFYMVLSHHACGLFAICGNEIKQATNSTAENIHNIVEKRAMYQQLKKCIMSHKRAIHFYELIDDMNRNSFLLQLGMNMIGISVTSVQTVMNLNRRAEAFRIGLFLVAQQFHLLFNSLPGQRLVDHSLQLAQNIYDSEWYRTPVRIQKLLIIMQMRSGIPCTLTAGGLYDMNIQNFGMIFKTCMSYFTMLMSLRE
ncbi:odorant receptor 67a-like isoform X2 [Hylaeus volcanicus]|uniref:odorant receptor 67a-like isoform X2 n=1 Tax=Hylaeus volcanicus TaxID=313075 RepID=UPI0023B7887C|nr:odorant receptor 67a-like isoform X2 [Hylaeus volcanicus]